MFEFVDSQHVSSSRILVVDDHALFRTGISMILSQYGQVKHILEATSVKEALKISVEPKIDVILLDLEMPQINGIDGISLLSDRFIDTPIIILSAEVNEILIKEAEYRGAAGFLHKSANYDEILRAIHYVMEGKSFHAVMNGKLPEPPSSEQLVTLTPRQKEVLAAMAKGLSNKVIARQLGMSENTVRVHVSAILSELGASNRTEATLIAQRRGLINTDG